MSDENDQFVLEIDGENVQVSLTDLAGIDMAEVEPYRGGEVTPEGVYEWRGKSAEIDTMEINDKDSDTGRAVRPVITFCSEALAVRSVKDRSIDPDSLVGVEHYERFFIRDLRKDLGRVTAFLGDSGMTGEGSLQDMLERFTGHEFIAAVKHRKDKNDPDRRYANLDMKTVAPIGAGAPHRPAAPSAPAAPAKPVGLKLGGKG